MLSHDLAERAMLGDCGANAIGAMIGVSAASSLNRPARVVILGAIATLTAASENVSFTKVIARTPALNWLDMLGRRPVGQQWPESGNGKPGEQDADKTAPAAETPRP
jgi:hypothetical protein